MHGMTIHGHLQRLEASIAAGDISVRIGAPHEGLCLDLVVLGYETIYRGLQFDDGGLGSIY